jgi:hypothetical protein
MRKLSSAGPEEADEEKLRNVYCISCEEKLCQCLSIEK